MPEPVPADDPTDDGATLLSRGTATPEISVVVGPVPKAEPPTIEASAVVDCGVADGLVSLALPTLPDVTVRLGVMSWSAVPVGSAATVTAGGAGMISALGEATAIAGDPAA